MMANDPIAPRGAINAVLREYDLDRLFDADAVVMGRKDGVAALRMVHVMALMMADNRRLRALDEAVVDMILHCPVCHMQHIDEVDDVRNPGWLNPAHISHTCLGCGSIWRPCDRPTNGVAAMERHGRSDTWPARGRNPLNSHDTGGIMVPLAPHLEAVQLAEAEKAKAASPAGKTPPPNCRDRMRAEGKAYPRVGCVECDLIAEGRKCPYSGKAKL